MAATAVAAETLRIVNWNVQLDRRGPGLLLRDLQRDDPQIEAVVRVLTVLDADVLVLTAFDYDLGGAALAALSHRLTAAGLPYPDSFALRPNTGVPTGLDLDGDGLLGGPRDAQGYGDFPGQAGMAVLSRLPVLGDRVVDLSAMLWRDLPGNIAPPMAEGAGDIQRLSTTGHWIVPILLPDSRPMSLLIWYATPPVFDGPRERNARRNHDEAAIWLRLFEGALTVPPPAPPFVVIGDANLDPRDGDGRPEALHALLAWPGLTDPAPRGTHGRVEPDHRGDAALDTALYDRIGGLRVDYVLPSADLQVVAAGVMWPADGNPMAEVLATASRHRPVWVDVQIPEQAD